MEQASGTICSYGHHENLKSFFGYRQAIFLESGDVALDSLFVILSRLFLVLPWLTQPDKLGDSGTRQPSSLG